MSVAIHASSISLEAPAVREVASSKAVGPSTAHEVGGAERFHDALSSLGRAIDSGEAMVRRALTPSAGSLGAADLIALQAGIYRYSEAIDLAAKLVDRAGAAIRITLQAGGQ